VGVEEHRSGSNEDIPIPVASKRASRECPLAYTFLAALDDARLWRIDVLDAKPWLGLEQAEMHFTSAWRELALAAGETAYRDLFAGLQTSLDNALKTETRRFNHEKGYHVFSDRLDTALTLVNRATWTEAGLEPRVATSVWQKWEIDKVAAREGRYPISKRLMRAQDWIERSRGGKE